ncbi:MAG: DapH/DapD/GlmU-related protein [Solirubrobacterales bacterium]
MKISRPLHSSEPLSREAVGLSVGAFTVIEANADEPIKIGKNVSVGHHAVIAGGVTLGDDVTIDDYCLVGRGSVIGPQTKVLYGGRVYEEVRVGQRCLLAGSIANWTQIGDDVTFMGVVAHSYRRPEPIDNWNSAPVPSPVIGEGAVIGENALLVGGIEIGIGAYVAAGELVRCNVPSYCLFRDRKATPLSLFRGFITSRR